MSRQGIDWARRVKPSSASLEGCSICHSQTLPYASGTLPSKSPLDAYCILNTLGDMRSSSRRRTIVIPQVLKPIVAQRLAENPSRENASYGFGGRVAATLNRRIVLCYTLPVGAYNGFNKYPYASTFEQPIVTLSTSTFLGSFLRPSVATVSQLPSHHSPTPSTGIDGDISPRPLDSKLPRRHFKQSSTWLAGWRFQGTSSWEEEKMDGADAKRSNHIPTFAHLHRYPPDSPGIPTPTREMLNTPSKLKLTTAAPEKLSFNVRRLQERTPPWHGSTAARMQAGGSALNEHIAVLPSPLQHVPGNTDTVIARSAGRQGKAVCSYLQFPGPSSRGQGPCPARGVHRGVLSGPPAPAGATPLIPPTPTSSDIAVSNLGRMAGFSSPGRPWTAVHFEENAEFTIPFSLSENCLSAMGFQGE
ncbi:hypothetical protein BDP81DRAFT_456189 [Colletotrichum phormii]|uniref:Uncharacterized protein n=1 Tax=Colletotrichum phormii TaxID=359342 RepID=A0AAI9ZBF9_9PEZI|nr:uncharacterized protein BDP81DRAFT_456189 [Colletotrichum phormii]KAK1621440.1 hypothetical protein BDP81DRAFT_456189 [Colletotrichum phormii]